MDRTPNNDFNSDSANMPDLVGTPFNPDISDASAEGGGASKRSAASVFDILSTLGDGEGRCGFSKPIHDLAHGYCHSAYVSRESADPWEFTHWIAPKIIAAPAGNHTPEEVARYAGFEYLCGVFEHARRLVDDQMEAALWRAEEGL